MKSSVTAAEGVDLGDMFLANMMAEYRQFVIFLLVRSALDEIHVNFFMSKRMQALLSPGLLAIFLCGYPVNTSPARPHFDIWYQVSTHPPYRKEPDESNKTTLMLPLLSLAKAITTNVLSNLIGPLPKARWKGPSQWEGKQSRPD